MSRENERPGSSEPSDLHVKTRIHYWLSVISGMNYEDALQFGPVAVGELDDLWKKRGYMGTEYLVNGFGQWTEAVSREEAKPEETIAILPLLGKSIVRKSGQLAIMKATSYGFNVTEFTPGNGYELACHFAVTDPPESWQTVGSPIELMPNNIVDIQAATIQPLPTGPMYEMLRTIPMDLTARLN
jgi:hypothetical protein